MVLAVHSKERRKNASIKLTSLSEPLSHTYNVNGVDIRNENTASDGAHCTNCT